MKYPCIYSLLTVFLEINATSLQKLDRIEIIPIFNKIKFTEVELPDAMLTGAAMRKVPILV